MSVPLKSIQLGQCYLTLSGQVRRVMGLLLDSWVQYEARGGAVVRAFNWRTDVLDLRSLAFSVEPLAPCDWTLEADE